MHAFPPPFSSHFSTQSECTCSVPPANEIYRQYLHPEKRPRQSYHTPALPTTTTWTVVGCSLFQCDGSTAPLYSQCVCTLGKLFIDHKTLFYDVDSIEFFVLYEIESRIIPGTASSKSPEYEFRYCVAGFFSKEKSSAENNLACLFVSPHCQKRGYGRFLIDASFEITRRESKQGGPERPLSDLGKAAYRSYYSTVILELLRCLVTLTPHRLIAQYYADSDSDSEAQPPTVSTLLLNDLCAMTGFRRDGQCVTQLFQMDFSSLSVSSQKLQTLSPHCSSMDCFSTCAASIKSC